MNPVYFLTQLSFITFPNYHFSSHPTRMNHTVQPQQETKMLPPEYLIPKSTMCRCTSSSNSSFSSASSDNPIHISIHHSDKNEDDINEGRTYTQQSITTSTKITSKPTNSRPSFRTKLASRLHDTLSCLSCLSASHPNSKSTSSFTLSSNPHIHETTPLLPKPKPTQTTSTPPFRNIYDYSQGPRPLKFRVRCFEKPEVLNGVEVI
jgi:hypothetical protein